MKILLSYATIEYVNKKYYENNFIITSTLLHALYSFYFRLKATQNTLFKSVRFCVSVSDWKALVLIFPPKLQNRLS